MGKQKAPASTSPQVVATLSSLLLLVVSAALGFYFTELRGPGIRTLLSGSQASELMVLVGGLAAIVLTGHLAIANAARSAQGASGYRKLVKRASEIDYSDPEAVSQFDSVPELRDLVSVLIAEKEQGHQLQDALESVRGETAGLYSGMERSLSDMGPMREEQPSELGRKVATLWNVLVDRVNEAESAAPQGAPMTSLSTAEGYELGAGAVEQRLRDLEERVQQLQTDSPATQQLLVAEEESGTTPLLVPESEHEVIDLEARAAVSPLELQEQAPVSAEPDPVSLSPEPVAPVAQVAPSSAPSVLGGEPQEVSGLEALEPLSDEEMAAAAPQDDVDYSDNGSVIIQRPDFAALGMTPPAVAGSDPVAPAPAEAVDSPVAADPEPAASNSMIMQSPFAAGEAADASVDNADVAAAGAPEFSVPWGETQAPAAEAAPVEPVATQASSDVPVASPVDVDVDPVGSSEPMPVPPALADNGEDDADDDKTYTEWGGAGFGSLSDLTSSTAVGFGSEPAAASQPQPQPAQEVGFGAPVDSTVDRQRDEATPSSSFSFTPMGSNAEASVDSGTPAQDVTPATPAPEASDAVPGMSFPKFGSPQDNKDDHVEVTYDGTQAPAATDDFMSFDAPAEDALVEEGGLLEIDDNDVVDLNSLGAVETKE